MGMNERQQSSILIVDDDCGNRKQWRVALESAAFRVLEADSRVAALTRLGDAASGIDLLVTDNARWCGRSTRG
jgi:CheY-like chemotaxis protein